MSTNHLEARKWVSDRYLAHYYSVSRKTVWTWAKTGQIPKPKKIGQNSTRWDFDEIQAISELGGGNQ